jgi:DNA-binding transcriptional MerR regulator
VSPPRSYRIGEIAEATGVTPETLRYYERQGLLTTPVRSVAGARRYTEDAIARVRFIRQAQSVGLSLKDIRVLIPRSATTRASCRKIRAVLAARLSELDQRIAELQTFRSVLAEHLSLCDRTLEARAEADCPTIAAIAQREVRS